MKRKYIVSALALIIVIIVAILSAVFLSMNYVDRAKALYDEGQTFRTEADYGSAINSFQTLVDEFPGSHYTYETNLTLIANCSYSWGLVLENQTNYSDAIEKYQMASSYRYSGVFYLSEDAMLGCYYHWGESLQSSNNYGEALEKFQLIYAKESYYKPNWSMSIGDRIPECYFQWGQYLQSQMNFSGALEKYEFIANSTTLPFDYGNRNQAEAVIPQCYYEWVTQLVTAKEYDEAIQKYVIIVENYSSTVWASSDKANILNALPANVLFTWATTLQQEKTYNSAIRLYETLLQYYPGSQYASEAEKARIETEIAKIVAQSHGYLPPPSALDSEALSGKAELTIINDTPYKLTIFLSGPTTKSVIIQASPGSFERSFQPFSFSTPPASANRQIITLESGAYRMAAEVDKPGVTPYYGEMTLTGDTQYQDWLYILSQSYG